MQTQTPNAPPAGMHYENVFDENGEAVQELVPDEPNPQAAAAAPADVDPPEGDGEDAPPQPPAAPAPAAAAAPATPKPPAKFRIGDQEFATQEEALAYADQITRDGYAQRQLLQNLQAPPAAPAPSVTPPAPAAAPALNYDELFQNPQAFLQKYGQEVYNRVMSDVQRAEATRTQSDAIWREFSDRHPALSEFRADVEGFVNQNMEQVRSIIQTKGRPASYDFIATKLRSDWERRANVLKPSRELPNTRVTSTPGTRSAAPVTPEVPAKKPQTMREQINSIRKRGRK